jgi:hypothetical protein
MKWPCSPDPVVGDRMVSRVFALWPTVVKYRGVEHWVWLEKFEEVRELQLTEHEDYEELHWAVVERTGL